jgi:hypothetical protein
MDIREFKYQEKHTKKTLLASFGVFIGKRKVNDFCIYLFQMPSFYVEMYFDEEEGEIGYMRAFSNTNALQPYLDAIDISEIFAEMVG